MSSGFSVTIEDLSASSRTFARLHTEALDALAAAAGGLAVAAGMAGDDPVLAPWRAGYDGLTAVAWSVVGTSTGLLADIADRLVRTGNGYLDADRASGGAPGSLLPEPPPPGSAPPGPPSSTGPAGPGVPAELAAYWPGGDPALLRDAARAWSVLADRLDDGASAADAGFRSLTAAGSGATFSAMGTYWAGHYEDCGTDLLFNAGPTTARRLARSCAGLADAIDRSRAEVGRAAVDAAADLDHVAAPAHLLGRITRGATEVIHLVGVAALTTKYLDAYRDYYLQDIDRLVDELRAVDRAHLERLTSPPPPTPAVDVTLADVGDVVGLGLTGSAWDGLKGDHPHPDAVHLTAEDRTHILDGDGDGVNGGHLSGRGIPGKSEFPPSWSADRIVTTVLALARAPDTPPAPGREGCWLVEGVRDGVRVRVVVDPGGTIITAYPLSGPGVIQNPRGR